MGIITCYTLIRTSADITKLGESSLIVEMKNMINNSIPISTKWLLDAVGEIGRSAINSVCLIVCTKTNSKGTGFLIKSGHIITNWHVIRDCNVTEVVAISSNGKIILFQNMLLDKNRDLAILKTTEQLGKGLEIIDQNINVGTQVLTWGYPLGYNGPPPILSVGYLAGFSGDRKDGTSKVIKHYVINAAFNPGNSGGPLLFREMIRLLEL
jgi:S1-C subfamily serine protease